MLKIHVKKKTLLIIAAAALLSIIGSAAFFFEYSTSPQFCRSCHIMKPYYESWKASKHNKVACVQCHYPPAGPRTYLWMKFQAMSQVVKYVTKTYSSRPFAEIDDAACLRSGCHTKGLLEGKLKSASGVKFDHAPHLTGSERGGKLRCVSCHSQITVGRHIDLAVDSCYLCHFKGSKGSRKLEPLGGCTSCHDLPEKEFVMGNIKYRHKDFVAKHGIECQNCHLDVIQGEGDAPKEKCYSCHNEPGKIEKYEDVSYVHESHVTAHGAACFRCHTKMEHSVKTVAVSSKVDCGMCHVDMHAGPKNMYEGRGARGVSEMPSPMHLAGVDCLGCHIVEEGRDRAEQKFVGKTYKASEKGCVKCHGEKYAGLLEDWRREASLALKAIGPRIDEARNIMAQTSEDAPNFAYLKNLFDGASYNYDFVRLSMPLHNIYYSSRLLQNANNDLDKFSKESNRTLPPLPKASLLDGSYCATLCHAKLDVKIRDEVKYKDRDMPHGAHIELVGTCGSCHAISRHKEMPLKEDLSICKTCHEGGM